MAHLCLLGGKSATATLVNIIKSLITIDVAKQLSLRGTSTKKSFSTCPYIMDAILQSASQCEKKISLSDVESFLKNYFRNAKNR